MKFQQGAKICSSSHHYDKIEFTEVLGLNRDQCGFINKRNLVENSSFVLILATVGDKE